MSVKNKAKCPSKVETVEEFLARGGSINRIPENARIPEVEVIRKTQSGGPAVIMTLDEADLFYGEARKGAKAKKSKPTLKIDLDALPPALRSKFIAKLKEEVDGEGYEEELEEIESGNDSDGGDEED